MWTKNTIITKLTVKCDDPGSKKYSRIWNEFVPSAASDSWQKKNSAIIKFDIEIVFF